MISGLHLEKAVLKLENDIIYSTNTDHLWRWKYLKYWSIESVEKIEVFLQCSGSKKWKKSAVE